MSLGKIDYRRVFINTTILSVGCIYFALWFHMLITPEQYKGSDFIAFYAAGRIAQNEGPSQAYDLSLQQKYEGRVVGFEIRQPEGISPFMHPPFIIPLAKMIASSHYLFSLIAWNLIMTGFFIAGSIPLVNLLKEHDLEKPRQHILFASILLFFPFFESLLIGQNSAILFLGASIWAFGILTKQDRLAGLGLSITTIRPHIALLLAAPFFFKRANVLRWFVIGTSALGIFSFAYVGMEGMQGFLRILLLSGSGSGYNTSEAGMVNAIGLMLRLLPFVPAHVIRFIGWGIYGLTLIGLCIFWARSERIGETQIGVAVIASVFAAPHLHYHDLSILMIPLLALMLIIIRNKYWDAKNAALVPLGISVFLLFTSYSEIFYLNVHYLVELLLFLGLLFPEKLKPGRQKQTVQT